MDLRKASRDPWVWGQLALFVAVGAGAPLLPTPPDGVIVTAVGVSVLLAGLLLAWRSVRALGANLTPGVEPLAHASLVTSGPYRYIRHPIYTAVILILTGYTLVLGNVLLGAAVFLGALVYFEGKARAEERWLRQRMPEYTDYARRVPRLIPGGWR